MEANRIPLNQTDYFFGKTHCIKYNNIAHAEKKAINVFENGKQKTDYEIVLTFINGKQIYLNKHQLDYEPLMLKFFGGK